MPPTVLPKSPLFGSKQADLELWRIIELSAAR